jgi:hypothetical protein
VSDHVVDGGCPLCQAAPLTQRLYEDDVRWIADCIVCRVPMVVWKEHGAEPGGDLRRHMLDALGAVVAEHFAQVGWLADTRMRMIPDHFYAHARLGYQPVVWSESAAAWVPA